MCRLNRMFSSLMLVPSSLVTILYHHLYISVCLIKSVSFAVGVYSSAPAICDLVLDRIN